MENIDDKGNIFVLDYLCTWKDNIKQQQKKGNYDPFDMIGYGYYMCGDEGTEFVNDTKWDYDSFEYYDKELTGRYRVLKDISSFIKEKISLELFVRTYEQIKKEELPDVTDWFTEEGKRLAGIGSKEKNN